MGILFIPILLVIMYLLILRPQQKRDERATSDVERPRRW